VLCSARLLPCADRSVAGGSVSLVYTFGISEAKSVAKFGVYTLGFCCSQVPNLHQRKKPGLV
jgi:hypothetical protein